MPIYLANWWKKPELRAIRTDKAIECCRKSLIDTLAEVGEFMAGALSYPAENARGLEYNADGEQQYWALYVPTPVGPQVDPIKPQTWIGTLKDAGALRNVVYIMPVVSWVFMLEALGRTEAGALARSIVHAWMPDTARDQDNDRCYICNMRRSFGVSNFKKRVYVFENRDGIASSEPDVRTTRNPP